VKHSIDLGIGIAVVGAATIAGVWTWKAVRRWRQKDPAEIERLRRQSVNAYGRIISGRILELLDPVPGGPAGPTLLYEYEVAGVTYEAAQDVSAIPEVAAAAPFLPGQITSLKYDPRQPTNSILACEDWCDIPDLNLGKASRPQPAEPSPKTP
jgi:hypothetical protein